MSGAEVRGCNHFCESKIVYTGIDFHGVSSNAVSAGILAGVWDALLKRESIIEMDVFALHLCHTSRNIIIVVAQSGDTFCRCSFNDPLYMRNDKK
jgi:hypothetical protein